VSHLFAAARARGRTGGQKPKLTPRHARIAQVFGKRPQRATVRDRFFLHTRLPERDPGAELREATIRTCERINQPAPWLHGGLCRYGVDQDSTPEFKAG